MHGMQTIIENHNVEGCTAHDTMQEREQKLQETLMEKVGDAKWKMRCLILLCSYIFHVYAHKHKHGIFLSIL